MSEYPFHDSSLVDIPCQPGVYRFINDVNNVIYVGKATNLRNRVRSYFKKTNIPQKIKQIQTKSKKIVITITRSDHEALILENKYIKQFQPCYNVLLKDDKTYPFISLSQHDFPRLHSVRAKRKKERLFGPYTHKSSVRVTIDQVQRLFRLRSCKDSYFNNRLKPCLQYQLNRCSAPCVGYISKKEYEQSIQSTKKFLLGHNNDLLKSLSLEMSEASDAMNFEKAALIRDKIKTLHYVQSQHLHNDDDITDIFSIQIGAEWLCIYQMTYIGSSLQNGQPYFYQVDPNLSSSEVLTSFLIQYYRMNHLNQYKKFKCIIDPEIQLPLDLCEIIKSDSGRKVIIVKNIGIHEKALIKNANENVSMSLLNHQKEFHSFDELIQCFDTDLILDQLTIECYDISHQYGKFTTASCVVFDQFGPLKEKYRRYNLVLERPSDDGLALFDTFKKRFLKRHSLPDLLVIDGGEIQINAVMKSLESMGYINYNIIGIAKGRTRKVGMEQFYRYYQGKILSWEPDLSVKKTLLWLRDEAHRFAITHSRKTLQKDLLITKLDRIPGIGQAKKKQLIQYFGGWKGLSEADVSQISKAPMIGQKLANKIYNYLHDIDLDP